jgi:NhaA family Na+:H+ antiporter
MAGADDDLPGLPTERVQSLTDPIARFLHVEAAGGGALVLAAGIALGLANSPFADAYLAFWKIPIGFEIGDFRMIHSLQHWISDGLMAIFFFVVGLELKREIVLGELRDPRQVGLPIAAALGGMVVPAALYVLFLGGGEGTRGWGIPMATDIAFVVGCLAILGPRVPRAMRVLMLSLAIVDDLGAILVIAVGYTEALRLSMLALGVAGLGAMLGLRLLGVRSIGVYVFLGAAIWLGFHESGVHATVAGVAVGLITPTRSWVGPRLLTEIVDRAGDFLSGEERPPHGVLRKVEVASREALPPLERLETALHPWVTFVAIPLFALANAGVPIALDAMTHPVSMAVIVGLVVGKPLGIVAVSFLAVRLGLARLPDAIGWRALLGGGALSGIGFTMSIFIAGLALEGSLLDAAKIGILVGSLISAAIGFALLLFAFPAPARDS